MSTISGTSDAARLLDQTRTEIFQRCNNAVTLSRSAATEAIFEAWQATDESWKLNDDEDAISEEVRDTAIRFVESLPLGFPLPEVMPEQDGHINLEWYRDPRRLVSVSIAPNNRLFWAALIGTENPRGTARFIDRVPAILIDQIARVFEG